MRHFVVAFGAGPRPGRARKRSEHRSISFESSCTVESPCALARRSANALQWLHPCMRGFAHLELLNGKVHGAPSPTFPPKLKPYGSRLALGYWWAHSLIIHMIKRSVAAPGALRRAQCARASSARERGSTVSITSKRALGSANFSCASLCL